MKRHSILFTAGLAACLAAGTSGCDQPAEQVTRAPRTKVVEETFEDGTAKRIRETEAGVPSKEIEYHENGQKALEGGLNKQGNREGLWTFWFKSGLINSESEYRNGERHGRSTVYWPNGFKRFEGQFKMGKRVGMWYFWLDSGKLEQKIDYANGDLEVPVVEKFE